MFKRVNEITSCCIALICRRCSRWWNFHAEISFHLDLLRQLRKQFLASFHQGRHYMDAGCRFAWNIFRVIPPTNNHTSLARFICSHLFLSTREYGPRFYLSLTHIRRYWILTREKNGLSFSNCLNYLWTWFDRICISFKWYDWKWVNKIQIFKQPCI